jgi:hypothetical protein
VARGREGSVPRQDEGKGHKTRTKLITVTNDDVMCYAEVVQWSEFLATQRRCIVFPVKYELNLYMLCRRK